MVRTKKGIFRLVLNYAFISFYFASKIHFEQNQIISNNMTLSKFEKCVIGHKKYIWKKVWSEKIIVNCDVICGADKKGVVCLFPHLRNIGMQGTMENDTGNYGNKRGIIELYLDTENHRTMYSYRNTGIFGS